MRTADEHTKLARVALDFDPDLDDSFEISVNKTRVKLSAELRDQLKEHVARLATLAKNVYNRKDGTFAHVTGSGSSVPSSGSGPVTGGVPNAEVTRRGSVAAATSNGLVTVSGTSAVRLRYRSALEAAAAQVSATESLEKIVSVIQRSHPEIARELGW